MRNTISGALVALTLLFAGCVSWFPQQGAKQTGSAVDYLYPDAKQPPNLQPTVTYIRPPVRVGIAFVPGGNWAKGLTEKERMDLLDRVKESFSGYDFIGGIEVIPGEYMRPQGGFTNLEQVARLLDVEVVALLSFDQVQFNDSNALSMLYWTLVGAYVIHGDRYDIQTMVDAAVFDVKSHKLLFRAAGTSQVKGSASLAGFNEQSRAARTQGYDQAVNELIPHLKSALETFRERIRTDSNYRVENKPGYSGGGDFGAFGIVLALILAGIAITVRRES
ncbi:MAG: rhombotarget lipoprotein [Betaproteobacteria bacterium]|nr:rhombotarget lipoprotein [Betaproteobacteria bacterium]